jgi:hypothetical protein
VKRDTKKPITKASTPPPIPGPKYKIIIVFVNFNIYFFCIYLKDLHAF